MEQITKRGGGSHNYEVDFWRFVFAVIVVILHSMNVLRPLEPTFTPFQGGAIAVEFFLLLSGFFMMKSLESKKLQSIEVKENSGHLALKFTWRKIKAYFPYVIPSVLITYGVYAIVKDWSFAETLKQFSYSIYEMLLLPMTGIRATFFNLPLWYLACFIIVLPVIAYLILRFRDFYIHIFAFIGSAMMYGYIITTYKKIEVWNQWLGWTYVGVLRVIAGLCLGCICYLAYKKLKEINFTKFGLWIITCLHIGCFIAAIIRMYFSKTSRLDILVVMLLMIAVIMMFTQKSYLSKLLNHKVLGALGKISLPLYTSHWLMIQIVLKYFPNAGYIQRLIIYISFSMVLALLLYLFVEAIKWLQPLKRLRKLLINEELRG